MTSEEREALRLKILNGIEWCTSTRGGCNDCPYWQNGKDCIGPMLQDAKRYLLAVNEARRNG